MEKHSGKGTGLRTQMMISFIVALVLFIILVADLIYLIPKIIDNSFSLISSKIFIWLAIIWLLIVFYNFIIDILYMRKYKEKTLAVFGFVLSIIVLSILILIFILSLIFSAIAK